MSRSGSWIISGRVASAVSGLLRPFPQKTEHKPLDSNPRWTTIRSDSGDFSWIVMSQPRSAVEASTKVNGRVAFGRNEQARASPSFPCAADRPPFSTRWVAYTRAYTHPKEIRGQMRPNGSTQELNRKSLEPGFVHMETS